MKFPQQWLTDFNASYFSYESPMKEADTAMFNWNFPHLGTEIVGPPGWTREHTEERVAAIIDSWPVEALGLLYRTLHDGLGLRRHQCDSLAAKLPKGSPV